MALPQAETLTQRVLDHLIRGPAEGTEALLIADSVSVMTARPGRIKKRLVVNLPRPRSVEVTTSPVFNELKREVLALIREESLRAAREGLA